MNIKIGYGNGFQEANIDDKNILEVLIPQNISISQTEEEIVKNSLENPIGTRRLKDIVNKGEKIAVITSDITRPVPSRRILPYILSELSEAGVDKRDIILVFALGSHRKHSREEMIKLAGESIFKEYKCIDSDPLDCVNLGVTNAGTPVDITRAVAEADRRICIGNIEYHYFAGYSGGAKAVMPGCSTREAIQKNHSMMTRPGAEAANINSNPVRADLEEAIEYCNIDFILNVILDEKKRVIHAVSGDYIKAHRQGCSLLDDTYLSKIDKKADIVIASQGGSPKDINLYQLQKALDNAKNAVRDGGIIILVGECTEGYGEAVFEAWMKRAKSTDELIKDISDNFVLGGHKAAAIAMVLKKADIYLVSSFDDDIVRNMSMHPFKTISAAYKCALNAKGDDAGVIVMPYAGSTLPAVD